MPNISDYMLVIDNLSPTYKVIVCLWNKTIVLIDIENSLAN